MNSVGRSKYYLLWIQLIVIIIIYKNKSVLFGSSSTRVVRIEDKEHVAAENLEREYTRVVVPVNDNESVVRGETYTKSNDEYAEKRFNQFNDSSSLTSIVERYLNRDMVFIVGVQSSGTTLMRLLLDVHPDVNCGDETAVIYKQLNFVVNDILGSPYIVQFMKDFGVNKRTLNEATALFIYYMMENNKKNPDVDMSKMKYICNKEPDNTQHMNFLKQLFPNAKFVFIIRDGRDSAYSYFVREKESYTFVWDVVPYLERWNRVNKIGYEACQKMGNSVCHLVRYESLVTEPEPLLRNLMKFLNLTWTDDLLHHEKYIEHKKLSISKDPHYKKFPRKMISNSSIGKWRGRVAKFHNKAFLKRFEMLQELNYTD